MSSFRGTLYTFTWDCQYSKSLGVRLLIKGPVQITCASDALFFPGFPSGKPNTSEIIWDTIVIHSFIICFIMFHLISPKQRPFGDGNLPGIISVSFGDSGWALPQLRPGGGGRSTTLPGCSDLTVPKHLPSFIWSRILVEDLNNDQEHHLWVWFGRRTDLFLTYCNTSGAQQNRFKQSPTSFSATISKDESCWVE